MLANITAIYVNGNRAKGAQAKNPDDFIIKSAWKTEVEQDVDIIKQLFGIKK